MNIQIINETACFMYLNEQGTDYVSYFFINKYRFDQLEPIQLEQLKTRLEMEKVIPLRLYVDYNNTLYLACKNSQFIDDNYSFVFAYPQYRNYVAKGHDYEEKYIMNNNNFTLLHDFTEEKVYFTEVQN